MTKHQSFINMLNVFTATLRVSGSLQQSTEVMKYMQALVKVPEIQASMQELSREMMKVLMILCFFKGQNFLEI